MSSSTLLAPPAEMSSDLDCLQGTWVSIAGRRPMQLFVSGQRFTAAYADGSLYMGNFELHSDDKPHVMVMHIDEGLPRYKGKTAWCIYEFEDALLRWCSTEPGSGERIGAFPEASDSRYQYTVFRRARRTRE